MEDHKLIPVGKGRFAIVDREDYERLSPFKWHCNHRGYAKRSSYRDGKPFTILMHRDIINAAAGLYVDHINGDRLDNRKLNLRVCTPTQNTFNRRVNKSGKTSQYKGVYWSVAAIGTQRESQGTTHIALFTDEKEAARYYDAAARFYYGEFASTNFEGIEALSIEEIRRHTRTRSRSGYSSSFEGVAWHGKSKKWMAYFCVKRKHVHIGLFNAEEEAAIARDQKVKELGIKTRLNFPD